jgi:DNA-binding NtrC family response regulator
MNELKEDLLPTTIPSNAIAAPNNNAIAPVQINNPPSLLNTQPLIIDNDMQGHYEVEESLNIMDKEKELILKALKKHRGRRKDAATDLGISERTLYRKIKEYNIEE